MTKGDHQDSTGRLVQPMKDPEIEVGTKHRDSILLEPDREGVCVESGRFIDEKELRGRSWEEARFGE